jgi:hypothetical protein
MLSLLLILARVVAGVALLPQVKAKDWAGEPYPWLYSCALPIPPLASPKMFVLDSLEIHFNKSSFF